jgi:hypothetical protein
MDNYGAAIERKRSVRNAQAAGDSAYRKFLFSGHCVKFILQNLVGLHLRHQRTHSRYQKRNGLSENPRKAVFSLHFVREAPPSEVPADGAIRKPTNIHKTNITKTSWSKLL